MIPREATSDKVVREGVCERDRKLNTQGWAEARSGEESPARWLRGRNVAGWNKEWKSLWTEVRLERKRSGVWALFTT